MIVLEIPNVNYYGYFRNTFFRKKRAIIGTLANIIYYYHKSLNQSYHFSTKHMLLKSTLKNYVEK